MTFVSYAQSYEDVRLWRALGHIQDGCYLDVGAQHPIIDSVSNLFYLAGWRGAHVEPVSAYAAALREGRPDEPVFELALGQPGTITFYEFPETGISTGVAEIAHMHNAAGFAVRLKEVPVVPLSKIFADLGAKDIHWMKIDVEGMEADVIRSWGKASTKPWVLVIESLHPSTRKPTQGEWLDLVLRRGYAEVAFDGLNRYFVAEEHGDLVEALAAPPNIFDDFTVTRAHFSARGVIAEYAPAIAELESSLVQVKQEAHAVHLRAEELECATAALTVERANLDSELLAERTKAADLAAELERAHEAFATQVAADRANATRVQADLSAELERAHEAFATQVAVQAELERRLSAISDAAAASEQEHQRSIAGLEQGISEIRERLEATEQELDRVITRAETYHSIALKADALIRHAVRARHNRWRQLGEGLGIVRERGIWRALADWSLPVTLTSVGDSEVSSKSTVDPIAAINRDPCHRANSLQELLSWDGAEFVRCAHVTILGRQPDTEGEVYYEDRIRRGHSKLEILWQIRRSVEASEHDPGIAGLDRALKRAAWARRPFIGPLMKAFYATEGNSLGILPKSP
jgi:FkbM family methyltransferase